MSSFEKACFKLACRMPLVFQAREDYKSWQAQRLKRAWLARPAPPTPTMHQLPLIALEFILIPLD